MANFCCWAEHATTVNTTMKPATDASQIIYDGVQMSMDAAAARYIGEIRKQFATRSSRADRARKVSSHILTDFSVINIFID
jgi:hypothetical protein